MIQRWKQLLLYRRHRRNVHHLRSAVITLLLLISIAAWTETIVAI